MPTTILDGETYEQARHRRFTEEAKVIEKMQQDEIIRMARDAGIVSNAYDAGFMDIFTKKLERFAALVAEPWIETNKALAKEIIELQKQAEQEPVGRWNWNEAKFEWLTKFDYHKHHMTPLYAAPVRTKDPCHPWQDLTDAEIREIEMSVEPFAIDLARAVIAADRENNK